MPTKKSARSMQQGKGRPRAFDRSEALHSALTAF